MPKFIFTFDHIKYARYNSFDIKMNMNIPRSVKEETRTQRSTNPGPKDGWKRFLSNSDNKNNLIALFAIFFKSSESEEYHKYISWYVIIYIRDCERTFAYAPKIPTFTIRLVENRKHLRKSVNFKQS